MASRTIQYAKLARLNSDPGRITATVAGWGSQFNESGPYPDHLRKVSIPVIRRKKCRRLYPSSKITKDVFCAEYPGGGRDSCQGDSGGPIFSRKGTVLGVVSFGGGDWCGEPGFPGVYARIGAPAVREFVDENL